MKTILLNSKAIKNLIISDKLSVLEVLDVIEKGGHRIALVINSSGLFKGIVTDYDVRRAIIKFQSLNFDTTNAINSNPIIRFFWLFLGLLFSIIGLIGLIVPGLPTTPLMIVAAACFFRSSKRLFNWVLSNKYFGKYVKDFRAGKGMPRKAKLTAIFFIWLFVSFSVFVGIPNHLVFVKVITLIAAFIGTGVIMILPTY